MTYPALTAVTFTVTPITLSCACSSTSSSVRLSCASSLKTLTNQTSNRRSNISPIKSAPSDSTAIVDNPTAESSTTATSEEDEIQAKVGARVRVTVPLKVYHVAKVPELDLNGKEGKLKEYVAVWRGKHISANLPYKIEFFEKLEGRGDAPVKFFAHLKDDEFEFLD